MAAGYLQRELASQFTNGKVWRERGRIDLCIINESASACVIIENKINNAPDQDRQLERYHEFAKSMKMKVCAILYVSAFGDRHATIESFPVTPIAACNNKHNDLLHGWLLPSKQGIAETGFKGNEDILSFLHQYELLLKQLTLINNEVMIAQKLYELLNRKEDLEVATLLEKELVNIKLYRHQVFSEKMGVDYFYPFRKKTSYPGYINHMIFREWNYRDQYQFQFDIVHYRDYTRFVIYENKGRLNAAEMNEWLGRILGTHAFQPSALINESVQFEYIIRMSADLNTLDKLDREVVEEAKRLFALMKRFHDAA